MADTHHVFDAASTAWVFVSASDEPRHLSDIIFAVDTLRRRGVSDDNIFVFTDHPAPAPFLMPHGLDTRTHALDDICSTLANIGSFRYLALVVGGHGSPTGLISSTGVRIGPSELIAAIRTCAGLEAGILVLTTCYSGVFNYLHASKEPQIAVIGATNLNPSLSAGVQLNAPVIPLVPVASALHAWQANIFMLEFFNWLRHPIDIDGDGHLTLLDAYKHAGVASNSALRGLKTDVHLSTSRIFPQLEIIEQGPDPSFIKTMRIKALRTRLATDLDQLYLHQEAWTLHANFARKVVLAT